MCFRSFYTLKVLCKIWGKQMANLFWTYHFGALLLKVEVKMEHKSRRMKNDKIWIWEANAVLYISFLVCEMGLESLHLCIFPPHCSELIDRRILPTKARTYRHQCPSPFCPPLSHLTHLTPFRQSCLSDSPMIAIDTQMMEVNKTHYWQSPWVMAGH